jgi:hypothetical protein
MWIRTQNEDALYDVIGVRAIKMVTEHSCSVIGILMNTKESVILGEYADFATAKAEVSRMEAFLIAGTQSVYQMQKATK